jgi:hypothetical protein
MGGGRGERIKKIGSTKVEKGQLRRSSASHLQSEDVEA